MSPYVTLGMRDPEAAAQFYDAVLATIGWSAHMAFGGWRAYSERGTGEGFTFWACTPYDGGAASVGNGTMVAFPARTRAEVNQFHAAAMANGGMDEGGPGPRESYGPNWYSAYMRDPSGNKIAVYLNRPEADQPSIS